MAHQVHISYALPTKDLLKPLWQQLYAPHEMVIKASESINAEYFYAFVTITENDQPKAHGIVYNNTLLTYNEKTVMLFGNVEFVEEVTIANLLFEQMQKIAIDQQVGYIIGPMHGSTWDTYRWTTSSHADYPTFVSESIQKPYYVSYATQFGFAEIAGYFTAIDNEMLPANVSSERLYDKAIANGYTARQFNVDKFDEELTLLYPFIKSVFKHNFLYTDISFDSFYANYKPIQKLFRKEFVWLLEKNGVIVSLVFFMPNIYDLAGKSIILKTIGNEYNVNTRGICYYFIDKVVAEAKAAGYTKVIHAFMYNHNNSVQTSAKYHQHAIRTYTLLGLTL